MNAQSVPTPVFLISFNRGDMLKRVIASIHRLSRPTEIIIHDNGSTDPETLDVLDEIARSGIKVFRYGEIRSANDLNNVDSTVQLYFSSGNKPICYVVSDCDIDMTVSDPRVLDVYEELLNKFHHIECVGPMLRIRDIPHDYPLFQHVMNRHIEQFWSHMPVFQQTSFGEVAILETVIDTTFALHRAGKPFRRLKKALRVYEPFEALHLDWYGVNAAVNAYSFSSSPNVSHWSNQSFLERYRDTNLNYSEFLAVRKNLDGHLEIYTEYLSLSHQNTECKTRIYPYNLKKHLYRLKSLFNKVRNWL